MYAGLLITTESKYQFSIETSTQANMLNVKLLLKQRHHNVTKFLRLNELICSIIVKSLSLDLRYNRDLTLI